MYSDDELQNVASSKSQKSSKNKKFTILSQQLLQAANLSARKDFLSSALKTRGKKVEIIGRPTVDKPMHKSDVGSSLDSKKKRIEKKGKDVMLHLQDGNSLRKPERTKRRIETASLSSSSDENEPNHEKVKFTSKEFISDSGNSTASEEATIPAKRAYPDISSSSSDSDNSATPKRPSKSFDSLQNSISLPKKQKIKVQKESCSSVLENDIEHSFKLSAGSPKKQAGFKLLDDSAKEMDNEIIRNKTETFLNSLSDDDEIYLVQMPKSLDANLLLNKTVSFDTSTQISSNNEIYECNVNCDQQNSVVLINFDKFVTFKLKGTVEVKNKLDPKVERGDFWPSEDVILDYQKNTKASHPLFGMKYKKKIKIDEDISRKLEDATCHSRKISKKKRKRDKKDKSKEENIVVDDVSNLAIFKLLEEHEKQKLTAGTATEAKTNKKIPKYQEGSEIFAQQKTNIDKDFCSSLSEIFPVDENFANSIADCDDEVTPLKKKKKKRKHHLLDNNDELTVNDTTDYDEPKHKKKKKKNASHETMTSNAISNFYELIDVSDASKHKKKKKLGATAITSAASPTFETSGNSILEDFNFNQLIDDCDVSKHKKKKKKERAIAVNSTMLPTSKIIDTVVFDLNESAIPKAKKKKKRGKHRDSIDDCINSLMKDMDKS